MRLTASDYSKFCILLEGAEDYLGITDFLWAAENIFRVEGGQETKRVALDLIREYLQSGLIDIGEPVGRGPDFAKWDLPAALAVPWIEKEWASLGRNPGMGQICWFKTTEKGKEWAERFKAEYGPFRYE